MPQQGYKKNITLTQINQTQKAKILKLDTVDGCTTLYGVSII